MVIVVSESHIQETSDVCDKSYELEQQLQQANETIAKLMEQQKPKYQSQSQWFFITRGSLFMIVVWVIVVEK